MRMTYFLCECNHLFCVGQWVPGGGGGGGGGTCLTWSTKDFTEGSSNALFSVANLSLAGDNATSAGYPYLRMQQQGTKYAENHAAFLGLP